MSADYFKRSHSCLEEARAALARGDHPLCVVRAQEALGMAVKSLLRALAIEYPRVHDVSPALLSARGSLPEPVKSRVEELASLVSELASVRGPAMYGYEAVGVPASEVVSESYAREVLRKVESHVEAISRALIPALKGKGYWKD
jgi:HEPN domain-containing protein